MTVSTKIRGFFSRRSKFYATVVAVVLCYGAVVLCLMFWGGGIGDPEADSEFIDRALTLPQGRDRLMEELVKERKRTSELAKEVKLKSRQLSVEQKRVARLNKTIEKKDAQIAREKQHHEALRREVHDKKAQIIDERRQLYNLSRTVRYQEKILQEAGEGAGLNAAAKMRSSGYPLSGPMLPVAAVAVADSLPESSSASAEKRGYGRRKSVGEPGGKVQHTTLTKTDVDKGEGAVEERKGAGSPVRQTKQSSDRISDVKRQIHRGIATSANFLFRRKKMDWDEFEVMTESIPLPVLLPDPEPDDQLAEDVLSSPNFVETIHSESQDAIPDVDVGGGKAGQPRLQASINSIYSVVERGSVTIVPKVRHVVPISRYQWSGPGAEYLNSVNTAAPVFTAGYWQDADQDNRYSLKLTVTDKLGNAESIETVVRVLQSGNYQPFINFFVSDRPSETFSTISLVQGEKVRIESTVRSQRRKTAVQENSLKYLWEGDTLILADTNTPNVIVDTLQPVGTYSLTLTVQSERGMELASAPLVIKIVSP